MNEEVLEQVNGLQNYLREKNIRYYFFVLKEEENLTAAYMAQKDYFMFLYNLIDNIVEDICEDNELRTLLLLGLLRTKTNEIMSKMGLDEEDFNDITMPDDEDE